MKKKGIRVPGIGHRIKSKDNRDKRVELLIAYARRFFPATKYLNYALVRMLHEPNGKPFEDHMLPALTFRGHVLWNCQAGRSASARAATHLHSRLCLTSGPAVVAAWDGAVSADAVECTACWSQRVEAYTLQKAANLVMNVDGCIGALFLDLLHSSSMFTEVCTAGSLQSVVVEARPLPACSS